jgi:hypothetical protein
MNRYPGRLTVPLSCMLIVAACGPSPQQRTTRLLEQRLQAQLGPDIADGRVAMQELPEGARVTLLGSSLFPNGPEALDDKEPDTRANVIGGLLDPSLMRVQVADSSALPADERAARVRNVENYFAANGLGQVLVPAAETPATAGPAGLTITIHVQCPPGNRRTDLPEGASMPVCE